MSDRYSWATSGVQGRGGRAAERMDWTLGRALAPEGAPLPPGDGAAPVGGGGGGAGAGAWPRPTGSDALWQSVGPTATVRGAVDSDVRVAGRVNGIAVSPDGTRAYAVSALGGLWYSENGGISWEPIGAWRTSDQATLRASSHTLSGGAVHVYWGVDAGDDEVWLGTGEPVPATSRDRGYVGAYGGVGILHKTGPVVAARQNRLADPWDAPPQAIDRLAAAGAPAYAGLRGQGVFAFANDPATADLDAPRRLLAATTAGLHRHDPLAAAGTEWSLVPVAAWEALRPGISARAFVTDVAWLPATARHAARVWVCVVDKTVAGLTGLWVGTGGGPLAKVALPGLPALPAGKMRLTLAAHPNHPDLLYVLGSGPSLWRIDGAPAVPPAPAPPAAPVAVSVASLPAQLFGSPGDQSEWDCSAAIDPNNSARVMIGGAAVRSRLLGIAGATIGAWAAALYQLTVTPTPGGAPGTFTSNYVAGESADPAWVGSEVHADVHAITWLRTPGGPQHVWVGCDGGVFRSEQDGVIGSFEARSAGMSVAEPGFVANNPLSPGPVLAGMQDNGPQLRIGEGVWRQASPHGDGGGVAFDPGTPGRFVVQATQSRWEDDIRTRVDPQRRGTGAAGDGSNYDLENRQTSFYANAAVIAQGGAGAAAATRLALGTDRVWFSTQWGVVGSWVTLPTTTDPRAADNPAPAALVQDRLLPTGASPWGSTAIAPGIRALRWQTPLRLLAVTRGTVHALTDPGAPGAWGRTPVATRQAVPGGGVPAAVPAPAPIAGALPGFGEYNDLAVHDPVAGSFYLATSHPLEPLWWWDGARCHPTGLGSMAGGTRSPAYSVVTDLVTPTTATVYVGTTSGVWQGEFTAPAAAGSPPVWRWRQFCNGLPEAAAQDLAIGSWPRPGGAFPVRLLRVALQARGVFEVDLDAPSFEHTYLRVHPYDTRRILPAPLADPMAVAYRPRRTWGLDWAYERNRDHRDGAGNPRAHPDGTAITDMLWHASPDIVCRPAQVTPPVAGAPPQIAAPATLPWLVEPADRFWLWSLQTAIRALPAALAPDAAHVIPDGRWTGWWIERLRRIRTSLGLANVLPQGQATVDAALWNDPRVQAGFWATPWSGTPGEVDLAERVLGMATPRPGSVTGAAVRVASVSALRRRYKVDVCVHHRGLTPADGAQVAVTLLRMALPGAAAQWATRAAPPTAGLAAALDALPADTESVPAPNRLPGYVPPAPWSFADTARPARRPRTTTSAGQASVVTFDIDFRADLAGGPDFGDVLLLALVHRQSEPVTLPAGGIRAAVLGSSHAAARSVRVLPP